MESMEHTEKNIHKKLFRSQTNKVFAGICGGIAEYFDIDVTLIRVLWLLVVIFSGVFPGLLAYIIMIFIIPQKTESLK